VGKRIRRSGGECTECHNDYDLVLTVPSNPNKPCKMFRAKHDRLGGGKCPMSDRPVPMAYWPQWARDALKG
jgi:hypothetical protein